MFPAFAHFRRTATRDTVLHGQEIKEGEKVVMWYASSNRDETRFEDPDRFDIHAQSRPPGLRRGRAALLPRHGPGPSGAAGDDRGDAQALPEHRAGGPADLGGIDVRGNQSEAFPRGSCRSPPGGCRRAVGVGPSRKLDETSARAHPTLSKFHLLVDVRFMTIEPAGDIDGLIRRAIDPLQLMQRVADQALAMIEAADGVLIGLVVDPRSLRVRVWRGLSEPLRRRGPGARRQPLGPGDPHPHNAPHRGQRVRSARQPHGDARLQRPLLGLCAAGPGRAAGGHPQRQLGSAGCLRGDYVRLLSDLADFIGTAIGAATEFDVDHLNVSRTPVRRSIPTGMWPPGGGSSPMSSTRPAQRSRPSASASSRSSSAQTTRWSSSRSSIWPGPCSAESRHWAGFGGPYAAPPDVWFARAHRVGRGLDLEVALFEAALGHLGSLPPEALLAVNAGPAALASPRISAALQSVDPARIVLELTEHEAVENYPQLAGRLACLREAGVRLAIDDAGAGFASLMHILKLAPDFIKLDRELISGIDIDPVLVLAGGLAAARSAAMRAAVPIAEGIEKETELVFPGRARGQSRPGLLPGPPGGDRGSPGRRLSRRGAPAAPRPPRPAPSTERTAGAASLRV